MQSELIDSLKRRINLYRRYPYWRKQGVVFIHVPKAAGTTINRSIYGRTLGHYTVEELSATFPGLMRDSLVFTVVRNPYDRLYSAYRFARAGRTSDMGIRNPEKYRIPEFETFRRFVNDWLVQQDLSRADHVFRPQSHYICADGRCAVDVVCKLENLATDIRPVEVRLGRRLDLEPRNVTGLEASEPVDSQLRKTIHSLYKSDFELLEYAP